MESHKGLNNNSVIFNEGVFYWHGKERMDGDKILAQGDMVQAPNPKLVLQLFIIEYDISYVSDLDVEKFKKKFLPKIKWWNNWWGDFS